MTKKSLCLLFAFIFCGALAFTGCSGISQNKTAGAKINLSEAVDVRTYDVNGIPVTDGYIPFGEYQTYFRAAGELDSEKPVLLLLHGGPGSTHNYFEVLDRVAKETGRVVLTYDQLGCGNSYVENHPELWTAETWVNELENLIQTLGIKKCHLLGQSWGGMLAITYLTDRTQQGFCSVILSSTLPDSQLWGREQHRMLKYLPQEEQDAIEEAERTKDYSSEAYQAAIGHYMQLHCNDQKYSDDAPECLRRPKRHGTESYETAWGPDELTPVGTLADWNYTSKLKDIQIPAFIVSGTDDLCTPLIAKTMYDNLPDAKWELMPYCRHMCFVDDNDTYCANLATWMAEHDK